MTQPATEKYSDHGDGLGLRYGLSSMQGWRPEMEDTHDVKLGLKYGLDDWSFFAVFDGHAGKKAAGFASWNLLEYILRDTQFKLSDAESELFLIDKDPAGDDNQTDATEQHDSSDTKNTIDLKQPNSNDPAAEDSSDAQNEIITTKEDATKVSISENKSADEKTSTNLETSDESSTSNRQAEPTTQRAKNNDHNDKIPDIVSATTGDNSISDNQDRTSAKFSSFPLVKQLGMVKSAIRSGFLKIDESMRMASSDLSGCTAVCSFISPTHIFIANCGDSRAVLFDGNMPRFATEDHKPMNPKERKRIIEAGGTATERINGSLAVSRALGDFEFKKDPVRGQCEQLVSPEPEITTIQRKATDEFLVLACDGIWDVMSNYDLGLYIRHQLRIESDLERVCSSILDVCLTKGSRDNMSIIIVVFENGPKPEKVYIDRAKSYDQVIMNTADEILDKSDSLDFPQFLQQLEMEAAAFIPPGAGVDAYYNTLRDYYQSKRGTDQKVSE